MDFSPLLASLVTLPNLTLQIVVSAILVAFAQLAPNVVATKAYARLAPLLPLVLCALGTTFVPHSEWSALQIADRVFLGVTIGVVSGWTYKFVKQSILGADGRLEVASAGKGPLGAMLLVAAAGSTASLTTLDELEVPPAVVEPPLVQLASTASVADAGASDACVPDAVGGDQ